MPLAPLFVGIGVILGESMLFVDSTSDLTASSSSSDLAKGVDVDDGAFILAGAVVDEGVFDLESGSSLMAVTVVDFMSSARSASVGVSRLSTIVSSSAASEPLRC